MNIHRQLPMEFPVDKKFPTNNQSLRNSIANWRSVLLSRVYSRTYVRREWEKIKNERRTVVTSILAMCAMMLRRYAHLVQRCMLQLLSFFPILSPFIFSTSRGVARAAKPEKSKKEKKRECII